MKRLLRLFGFGNGARRVAYDHLMRLTDRQLADIGITRDMVASVVVQGRGMLTHEPVPGRPAVGNSNRHAA